MRSTQVVELINTFDDDLDKNPLHYKFKVEFKKNTPWSKDIHLDDIMSYNYNDILDYVEREINNKAIFLKLRKILSHSLILGKKEKDNKYLTQIIQETWAISTEYSTENELVELKGWKTLKRLNNRSKLTEQLAKKAKLSSLRALQKYKYELVSRVF